MDSGPAHCDNLGSISTDTNGIPLGYEDTSKERTLFPSFLVNNGSNLSSSNDTINKGAEDADIPIITEATDGGVAIDGEIVEKGNDNVANVGDIVKSYDDIVEKDNDTVEKASEGYNEGSEIKTEETCQEYENIHFEGEETDCKPSKKKRSRLEIELDIKENDSVLGEEYDTYGDENKVYRKYRLRDKAPIKHRPSISSEDDEDDLLPQYRDRRQKYNKTVSQVECTYCDKTFPNRKGYRTHMARHVPIDYTCSICKDHFKSNATLISHKEVHKSENFSCETCKMAFSDHCDYVTHNTTHMTGPYKCEECSILIQKIKVFQDHLITHYNKRIKCEICNKDISPSRYSAHLKYHSMEIECVECGKMCKSKESHEYHMASHTGVKRCQCLYCGKAFVNDNQKTVHTRTHTNERPYECKVCHSRFKQSADLRPHMASHESEKRIKCDLCPKKFYHPYSLHIHMRLHSNENLLECRECGKKFQNMIGLRAHTIYKHLDDKPHKCEPCDVAFKHKLSYVRHCRSRLHKNNVFGFMKKAEKK